MAIVLILSLLLVRNVNANWYAGNNLMGVYGVSANIYTPSYPIYRVPSNGNGQNNWVGTDGPSWIQTGWAYIEGSETTPRQYVETCIDDCYGFPPHHLDYYDFQTWGTGVNYQVEWIYGTTDTWCASINGISKYCQSIRTAPSNVQVKSEIQVSPLNDLHTDFGDVSYKSADRTWHLSNQGNYTSTFPYAVYIFSNYSFENYRLITLEFYLPSISKLITGHNFSPRG